MKTTWGDKEAPQTFFQNFFYSRIYGVIRLTLNQWQLCISQFCDIGMISQKFSQHKKRDYQLVAVSCL